MARIKVYLLFLFLFSILLSQAQRKELKGQLVADDEVEGIHIQNRTAAKFAVSNEDGSFYIEAKTNDTLSISSVKYKNKELVVNQIMEELGEIRVQLTENVNELNEVIIGEILTGSLESDLENSKAKTEINFYDLGIPGRTTLPMTQNERKLHDADGGPDIISASGGPYGAGVGVNFHKLLNKISGRTKKLRDIVELDKKDDCINRLRREYDVSIFENDSLAENLKNEYYLFCQEDEGFKALCDEGNDLKAIDFLKEKLKAYKKNRESVSKD